MIHCDHLGVPFMKYIVLALFSQIIYAGEPDNFSARLDTNAQIANADINKTINGVLENAIELTNEGNNRSCDRKLLLNFLKDDLDKNFPNIVTYLYSNIPLAGAIDYTQVPYTGKFPYGRTSFVPSTKIKVGNEAFVIGLDKLDHFFSHGFLYWKIVGENPDMSVAKINNALDLGIVQEDGPWGLKGYGVKSYGDLAANYKGLFFWQDLLDGKPPIIACENNHFILNKKFELEDYFDESMDESINCSSFATNEMLKSIKVFTEQKKISCPLSAATCLKLVKKYPKEIAKKILHPLCLGSGTSQIEIASTLNSKDVFDTVGALISGGGNLVHILFPPSRGATKDTNEVIPK